MRPALPPGARRLFPHHEESTLDPAPGSPLLIARLLEDGDAADLAWLTANVPEAEIAGWLERHGGRQLSRRSRAFWEAVLGRKAAPPPDTGSLLWPL